MKTRFAAMAASLAAVAGLTVAGASPAAADVPCTINGYSPRIVIMGLSPVTATFKVSVSGCSLNGWTAQSMDGGFFTYEGAPQETFYPVWNSDAGAKDVVVEATNQDWESRERVFVDSFYLKRRTAWQAKSFNASPEPVRKGQPISIKGRLLIADWTNDRYVGYESRTIAIQFRTPTGAYKTVKTAKTRSDGWVSTTVTASATGVWRVAYGGNTIAGSAYATGDAVQVVR